MLALTHVHPDHQGWPRTSAKRAGIPLACHADDVDAMEGRRPVAASAHPIARTAACFWQGPPHKVDRVLAEGDEVAGFRVVHAPGHAHGEVIFFRDSDRVAICGDVIRNMSYVTGLPELAEPPDSDTATRPRTAARSASWPSSSPPDPPRPRPRGDRHGRLRALRCCATRIARGG